MKTASRSARQLFDVSFVNGRLDEARALAIAEMLEQKRPRHAFQILKEFTRLLRLELAKHHVLIESATPLDAASKEAIIKALGERDSQTTFSITTTTSLIGGVRIQLGSDVWDGSVAARLEKLESLYNSTADAHCVVAPVLAPSSTSSTLLRCAPEAPGTASSTASSQGLH